MPGKQPTDLDVRLALQVCESWGADAAILLWFTRSRTEVDEFGFEGASYGRTREIGTAAAELLGKMMDLIEDSIIPTDDLGLTIAEAPEESAIIKPQS